MNDDRCPQTKFALFGGSPSIFNTGPRSEIFDFDIQSLREELSNSPWFILKFECSEKVRIACLKLLVYASGEKAAESQTKRHCHTRASPSIAPHPRPQKKWNSN
jgi:hypothetical protein